MIVGRKTNSLRGLTLMELTVAILILVGPLMGILEIEAFARECTLQTMVRRQLDALAHNKMEEIVAGVAEVEETQGVFYDSSGQPIGNGNYTWTVVYKEKLISAESQLPQEFYDEAEFEEPGEEDMQDYAHIRVFKVELTVAYIGVGTEAEEDSEEEIEGEETPWHKVKLETFITADEERFEDILDDMEVEVIYE